MCRAAKSSPWHHRRLVTPKGLPAERGIAHHFTDFRRLLDLNEVDLVVLGIPNDLHCEVACLAAEAGKHVVVEKPMALNLAECDRMIAACQRAGVILGYAEELCFAPKYVRLKQLIAEGALGKVHLGQAIREARRPPCGLVFRHQSKRRRSDVRHGLPRDRVLPLAARRCVPWREGAIQSVYAQMGTYVHGDKTNGDDEAVLLLTFEGGAVGLAEESWTKPGGMDDRAEVFGSEGQAYADILYGNALRAFSRRRATATPSRRPEPRPAGRFRSTRRSGITDSPRRWQHFVDCVREGTEPRENGHDGRAVVEAVHALYASAATRSAHRTAVCQRSGSADRSLATAAVPAMTGFELPTNERRYVATARAVAQACTGSLSFGKGLG